MRLECKIHSAPLGSQIRYRLLIAIVTAFQVSQANALTPLNRGTPSLSAIAPTFDIYALNRARYAFGVVDNRRRKLRRMVSSEPKPQRCEIRFTGNGDSDNSRRAASTRSRSMARAGVTPWPWHSAG